MKLILGLGVILKPEVIVDKIVKYYENREVKFKSKNNSYSIIIGNNILGKLIPKVKVLCPKAKKLR